MDPNQVIELPADHQTDELLDALLKANEGWKINFAAPLFESFDQLLNHCLLLFNKAANRAQFSEKLMTLIDEFAKDHIPALSRQLERSMADYVVDILELIETQPGSAPRTFSDTELQDLESDSKHIKKIKRNLRFRRQFRLGTQTKTPKKEYLNHYLRVRYLPQFYQYLGALNLVADEFYQDLNELIHHLLQDYIITKKSTSPEDLILAAKEALQERQEETSNYWDDFASRFSTGFEEVCQRLDVDLYIKTLANKSEFSMLDLKKFPTLWKDLHEQFLHEAQLGIALSLAIGDLYTLKENVRSTVSGTYFKPTKRIYTTAKSELKEVAELVKNQDTKKIEDFSFQSDKLNLVDGIEKVEELLESASSIQNRLPGSTEILSHTFVQSFLEGKIQPVQTTSIDIALEVQRTLHNHFLSNTQEAFLRLPNEFQQYQTRIRAIKQLVAINLNPSQVSGKQATKNLEEVISKGEKGLAEIQQNANDFWNTFEEVLEQGFEKIEQLSTPRQLLLRGELIAQEGSGRNRIWIALRRQAEPLVRLWKRVRGFVERILGRSREDYRQIAYNQQFEQQKSLNASLRDYVEAVSLDPQIEFELPLYYKQLFLGNEYFEQIESGFRSMENELARTAANRLKAGIGGAMMITGVPLSGKSWFSRYVAAHYFEGKSYFISPPQGGSTSLISFTKQIQDKLEGKGDLLETLSYAPKGSVIIFDEIELWWERSEQGDTVINQMLNLIKELGTQYHFILNCNSFTFQLLKQLTNIEEHLIASVPLGLLNSQETMEMLAYRYMAGRLDVYWKGKLLADYGIRERNKLLRKFHTYSSGNAGHALHLWLANIVQVADSSIAIQEPIAKEIPSIPDFDWLTMLTQFVLHKRVSLEKLARVYQASPEELSPLLDSLVRSGLCQSSKKTYELNPYCTVQIIQELQTAQLL